MQKKDFQFDYTLYENPITTEGVSSMLKDIMDKPTTAPSLILRPIDCIGFYFGWLILFLKCLSISYLYGLWKDKRELAFAKAKQAYDKEVDDQLQNDVNI